MKLFLGILVGLVLLGGSAQARDAFDAVRCGADIPKILTGKILPDGNAVETEGRHKNLGLVDEGADEMENHLGTISWRICGHSYSMIVDDKNVIRDVVARDHSRATPAFEGICMVAGKPTGADGLYTVLDNRAAADLNPDHHYSADDKVMLPALKAWRIDPKHAKFVPMPTAGMTCPRSGIYTADGGA